MNDITEAVGDLFIVNKIEIFIQTRSAKIIQTNFRTKHESKILINIINESFLAYLTSGSRSNKKTLILHNGLKEMIEKQLPEYNVAIEQNIESVNAGGQKSCDIVAYKNDIPHFIFPVKFIMTNYYQNKNNNWENLTGELFHLKKKNKNIKIIPINIIFNNLPYCKKSSCISKFEYITYNKSYKITENLVEWGLASDIINYIIDVEQICQIGEKYDKPPKIIGFNLDTPYRRFDNILRPIIYSD